MQSFHVIYTRVGKNKSISINQTHHVFSEHHVSMHSWTTPSLLWILMPSCFCCLPGWSPPGPWLGVIYWRTCSSCLWLFQHFSLRSVCLHPDSSLKPPSTSSPVQQTVFQLLVENNCSQHNIIQHTSLAMMNLVLKIPNNNYFTHQKYFALVHFLFNCLLPLTTKYRTKLSWFKRLKHFHHTCSNNRYLFIFSFTLDIFGHFLNFFWCYNWRRADDQLWLGSRKIPFKPKMKMFTQTSRLSVTSYCWMKESGGSMTQQIWEIAHNGQY